MPALSIILLLVGVAGAVGRPFGVAAWVVPTAAAGAALAAGAAHAGASAHALHQLAAPIGFLLAAVPLSVLLDELGFFAAAAKLLTRRAHTIGGLWVLAAAVTTVLNLDAAVVLLTPLFVRVAHRHHLDALSIAAQPLILSWLASSALPVSNLTNLIAASYTGASSVAVLLHLGPPSLAAVAVGWLCYRLALDPGLLRATALESPDASQLTPDEGRSLRFGGIVVAVVLAGFVGGRDLGIAEWEVALAADVVLLALLAPRRLPWRTVPLGTALVAASLGVLATAAAVHVPVARWLGGGGVLGMARTAGVAALAANAINNLPALLVLAPSLGGRPTSSLWAVLVGVNMGPVLLVTGCLASLLWVDTCRRMEVPVRVGDVSRFGWRVGLPGALAGLAVLLVMQAIGLGG